MSRILIASSLLLAGVLSSTSCDDSYECNDDTISDDYVYCRGFYGCYESSITATGYLDCNGDYGCAFTSLDASGPAYCNGNYGCYRAHLVNGDSYSYCDGNFGCYNAELNGYYVNADGYYGGYLSTFRGVSDTYDSIYYRSYGYFGAGYANLYSGEDKTAYFYLYGYYSGYQTFIDCESGSTCYVYCSGNGCYNTKVYSWDGSSVTVSCSEDYCPTEYTVSISSERRRLRDDTEEEQLIYSSDDDLKKVRRHHERERRVQHEVDKKKWTNEDSKFAYYMKNLEKEGEIKERIVKGNNGASHKGLFSKTTGHALTGAAVATGVYALMTLLWYYGYYKPRKGELYNDI